MSLAKRFEPQAVSGVSTAGDAPRRMTPGQLDPYGRTPIVRWLLDPVSNVSAEVHAALIGELDLSLLGTVVALVSFNALNIICCIITRAPVFFVFLAVNVLLSALRLTALLLVKHGDAPKHLWRTDFYVLITLVWCAFESTMAGLTILSGVNALELMGLALAQAPQGVMATRNLPAPRFASAMILAMSLPFMMWLFFAPNHWLMALALMWPGYLYATFLTTQRVQKLMIENYVAQFASRQQASHDALTGILNRRGLNDALERETQGNICFALFMMDLDGFKEVNDTHGHLAGDVLLQMVTARLHGVARKEDSLARLGGDEFALITPGLPTAAVEAVAARLVAALSEEPYVLNDGVVVRIGVSVGYVCAPEDGASLQLLNERADAALYAVKRGGKGSWQRATC